MYSLSIKQTLVRFGMVIAIFMAYFAIAPHAEASTCAPRKAIIKHLKSNFSEKLYSRGLVSEKLLMELYVSKGGSWTILFTSPKGKSCIVATGKKWLQIADNRGPEV